MFTYKDYEFTKLKKELLIHQKALALMAERVISLNGPFREPPSHKKTEELSKDVLRIAESLIKGKY